jgi:hypothetical protein
MHRIISSTFFRPAVTGHGGQLLTFFDELQELLTTYL